MSTWRAREKGADVLFSPVLVTQEVSHLINHIIVPFQSDMSEPGFAEPVQRYKRAFMRFSNARTQDKRESWT